MGYLQHWCGLVSPDMPFGGGRVKKQCRIAEASRGNQPVSPETAVRWLSARFSRFSAFALLSLPDYYSWMGHHGGFW
jgi:hypothetical protein